MKLSLPIPADFVLSILAPSYLVTHQWGRNATQTLIDIGQWSEEILRGDRLPPLPFPEAPDPDKLTTESNSSEV